MVHKYEKKYSRTHILAVLPSILAVPSSILAVLSIILPVIVKYTGRECTVKCTGSIVLLSSILAESTFKYTGRKCCKVNWQKALSSKLTIYWQSSTGILAIYWRYSQSEVLRWCCPFAQYRARVCASTVLTGLPTPATVRVARHTGGVFEPRVSGYCTQNFALETPGMESVHPLYHRIS